MAILVKLGVPLKVNATNHYARWPFAEGRNNKENQPEYGRLVREGIKMARRLAAKVGTYQKDGATKGEYAKLGVILSNQNGDYLLIDPSINLAGVLIKQNLMAKAEGKPERDMVMVSVFDDSQQQGQQSAPQQAPQQNNGGFDNYDDSGTPY